MSVRQSAGDSARDVALYAALDAACERAGIERGYHDIQGVWREASVAARRALLEASGLRLEEEASLEATPDAQSGVSAAVAWLPPVLVVRVGAGPIRIPLPAVEGLPALRWRLVLEDGSSETGRPTRLLDDAPAPAEADPGSPPIAAILLPEALPAGYHDLTLEGDAPGAAVLASMRVIACPPRCYEPPFAAAGARLFGLAVQLYAVRSRRNWGMGDFTDLAALIELAAASGAALVGLNPLHALFPHDPASASPYSPSNRHALNVLYLDVEAIDEFDECEAAGALVASDAFQARLDGLRRATHVDYAGVAAAKYQVLELLWRHFMAAHLEPATARGREFERFCRQADDEMRGHALHDALQQHLQAQDPAQWGWPAWPEANRDPALPAVRQFERERPDRIRYFLWLQWLADAQLAQAQQRARELGLPIGLYRDLAVGAAASGSETWLRRDLFALGARVGAPPDAFNHLGQDWGLPPEVPRRLRDDGYRSFAAMIRANMRHAGALRIDHVMGLMRRFWVPPGGSAADGTYVQYPFDDLAGIVALESHRARCIVIGEDLGVVPDAIRSAMREMRMLSYRPLYFEQGEGGTFRPPQALPRMALSVVSTHDLPTLRGFWRGADIEARQSRRLFPDDETRARSIVDRARDRAQLMVALEREGLLPPGRSTDPMSMPDVDAAFVQAVHRYLARSPTMLVMVQPDDVFEHVDQVNLPGTTESEHPNWRLRLVETLEDWPSDPRYQALMTAVVEERGRAPRATATDFAIPRATYRLQLHGGFGFAAAAQVVPYLAALGVSHVYASPFLKSRPGSTHGYDIVDHNALNPELGSWDDYRDYAQALERHGLRQLVDVVPNHMGVLESDNGWWLDVLENGRASPYAGHFDIDWEPASPLLRDKVLVPVLGEQYGAVLERGELVLAFDRAAGTFSVHHHGHRFPIDPAEYPRLLAPACRRAAERGAEAADEAELQSLSAAFGHLPGRSETADERVAERLRDKEIHKRRLAELVARSDRIAAAMDDVLADTNGVPDDPGSFEALHALIEAQAYRLAYWRVASDDINYRRFFDINDLAALRMDSERVFEDTHRLIFRLIDEGSVHGLRIDHPDGLRDPKAYFERLQRHCGGPGYVLDPSGPDRPVYLVVEKILAEHERLPSDWLVHGTTGYSFANLVNGLFIDPAARLRFDRLYHAFIGERIDYGEMLYRTKKLIMRTSLSSELTSLVTALHRIAGADRHTRDFTANSLRAALTEVVAHFPVYRTYVVPGHPVSEADRRHVTDAVAAAKRRSHEAEGSAIEFVGQVALGEYWPPDDGEAPARRDRIAWFIGRFQQYTAPVTAKAMEDTAFYRYNRLVSLNEVGGEPGRFGVTVEAFHAAAQSQARHWPHAMLATSTHDTKRGEDARVRLAVLSEVPAAWRLALRRWRRINASLKQSIDGQPAPSANDEYLAYQSLLAIWPHGEPDAAQRASLAERLEAYMLKAVREAKVHTSWINPGAAYEASISAFVTGMLAGGDSADAFITDFSPFARMVAQAGLVGALSQVAIKLAAPGVPDLYQGCELWNLTLVDPDNRRPVDFAIRQRWLEAMQELEAAGPGAWRDAAAEFWQSAHDGRIKLWTTRQLLGLRRRSQRLFERGRYLPLRLEGDRGEPGDRGDRADPADRGDRGNGGGRGDAFIAFARVLDGEALVLVATRLAAQREGWGEAALTLPARLPPGSYVDLLSGASFEAGPVHAARHWPMARLLEVLPVAALVRMPPEKR
jgi:(1->4)-alpha-D-glucan 1-alpha-D-glucosylmutase